MIGNPELAVAIVKENLLKDEPWRFDALGQAVVQDALREVLSLVSSTREGWRLVPVEPTEEMLKASWRQDFLNHGASEGDLDILTSDRWAAEYPEIVASYRALLAAAPTIRSDTTGSVTTTDGVSVEANAWAAYHGIGPYAGKP